MPKSKLYNFSDEDISYNYDEILNFIEERVTVSQIPQKTK